jgi:beta-lactam-binding protein with PASTA domain
MRRRPDVVTPRWGYVSVFVNTPGRCTVPRVEGLPLATARHVLARAHCRVRHVRWNHWYLKPGCYVYSQTPMPGTMLPRGGKVNLRASRGRKSSWRSSLESQVACSVHRGNLVLSRGQKVS